MTEFVQKTKGGRTLWDTVYMPVATAWMRAADEEHSTLEQQSPGRVQIAAATLSGNSLRQTVHTRRASVHQAAKLVAALLRVAGVTTGLAESNGSRPPGL